MADADVLDLEPFDFLQRDPNVAEEELWKAIPGVYVACQVRDEQGIVTRRTAYVCCPVPSCASWSSLWEFDIADATGLVDPPVKCPKCRSIFRARLNGWGDIDWMAGKETVKQELLSDGSGNK